MSGNRRNTNTQTPARPARVVPLLDDLLQKQWDDGLVICRNRSHYKVDRVALVNADGTPRLNANGNPSLIPKVARKSKRDLLALMKTGQKAECECLMDACEATWYDKWLLKNGTPTSRWVEFGSYVMGIDKPGAAGRRVWQVDYNMTHEQVLLIHKDFSTWWIIPGGGYHDHAVSHTRTELVMFRLLESLPASTNGSHKEYLDLHGNAKANRQWTHKHNGVRIDTAVEVASSQDAVRLATKWKDEPVWDIGSLRNISTHPDPATRLRMKTYDGFFSVHTLYYYSMEEINAICQFSKGTVLEAVMHRFQGEKGSFADGEVKWEASERDASGRRVITQRNAFGGGRPYTHPDNEEWFTRGSWAPKPRVVTALNQRGEETDVMEYPDGIAWSVTLDCQDVYHLRITSCPGKLCAMDEVLLAPPKYDGPPPVDSPVSTILRRGNCQLVAGDPTSVLIVDAPEAYEAARALCSGKPRDAKRFQDHLASVKRLVKSKGETADHVEEVALASYFADFERDRLKIGSAFISQGEKLRGYSMVMNGQYGLGTRSVLHKLLAAGVMIATSVNSPAHKVAENVLRHTSDTLDHI